MLKIGRKRVIARPHRPAIFFAAQLGGCVCDTAYSEAIAAASSSPVAKAETANEMVVGAVALSGLFVR